MNPFKNRLNPESHGEHVSERKVEISSGTRMVAGDLFFSERSKNKNPAILFLHGWRGSKDGNASVARRLATQGIVCLAIDLPGHGKSTGDLNALTRADFLKDICAAFDVLARTPEVDPADISIVGTSFGAYAGALLSGERSIKAMVFRAPADYPDDGFDKPGIQTADQPGVMEWRSLTRDFGATESLRRIHRFAGKLLVVESENDEMVPHGTVQSYMNAAPDPRMITHQVLMGAPHSLRGRPELSTRYEDMVIDWFHDLNVPSAKPASNE